MKGSSFSVVGIVAMLGVLAVAIWSALQLSVGPQYQSTITEKGKQDTAVAKLESTKALVSQDLSFGTLTASMDVSEQGGTKEPATYWYCSGQPTPPEFDEVNFALSNKSLAYLNGYIKKINGDKGFKEMGISLSEYECVNIIPPHKSACTSQDCEFFGSASSGGTIDVNDPAKVSYAGSVDSDNGQIRFWMFYYRLYDFFKDNQIMSIITDSLRAKCPGPEPLRSKVRVALEDVCDDIEKMLDPEYAECKVVILCEDDDLSCQNAPCERYFNENLCYNTMFLSQEKQRKIKLQTAASERFKFEITDHKYLPLGTKPMKWNLYAVIPLEDPECIPID